MFPKFSFRPPILAILSSALLWGALAVADAQEAPTASTQFRLQPLPIASWLSEDKVTVVSSAHDIGEIRDIFDGDDSTLLRSAAINPQQTTIQFDGTVTVVGTRVMISHHVGRWKMEAMVWPKDAKTPTKTELVPWTSAGDGESNELIFPRNVSVSEITLFVQRTSDDDFVHLNNWELLSESPSEIASTSESAQ